MKTIHQSARGRGLPSNLKAGLCLVSLLLSLNVTWAAQPRPASEIMQQAQQTAGAEKKNILLIFGEEGCSWCKVFHAFREASEIKPIFEKYFLSVDLQTGTEKSSNPGAAVFEKKYQSIDRGFPFLVFVKPDGAVIVNSNQNGTGDNTGYPSEPGEITWFMKMLEKGAPEMTASERKIVEGKLRAFRRSSRR